MILWCLNHDLSQAICHWQGKLIVMSIIWFVKMIQIQGDTLNGIFSKLTIHDVMMLSSTSSTS